MPIQAPIQFIKGSISISDYWETEYQGYAAIICNAVIKPAVSIQGDVG